jgi:glycine betaine/choline ABC-type transport system substrate-binding protein
MELEPQAAIDELNNIFKDLSSPLQWLGYTGFCNNWEMIIRRKDADNKSLMGEKITRVSQLRELKSKFTIGCEHDFFARPNGYTLLTKPEPNGYGLSFKNLKLFRHMDAYKNLDDSEVDIIDGFSTDPSIHNSMKYKRLEDDEKRFGYYYSSIVVREKIIDKYPEITDVLMKLEGILDAKQMSHMIEVTERYSIIDEREEHIASVENVAERFLDDNNL